MAKTSKAIEPSNVSEISHGFDAFLSPVLSDVEAAKTNPVRDNPNIKLDNVDTLNTRQLLSREEIDALLQYDRELREEENELARDRTHSPSASPVVVRQNSGAQERAAIACDLTRLKLESLFTRPVKVEVEATEDITPKAFLAHCEETTHYYPLELKDGPKALSIDRATLRIMIGFLCGHSAKSVQSIGQMNAAMKPPLTEAETLFSTPILNALLESQDIESFKVAENANETTPAQVSPRWLAHNLEQSNLQQTRIRLEIDNYAMHFATLSIAGQKAETFNRQAVLYEGQVTRHDLSSIEIGDVMIFDRPASFQCELKNKSDRATAPGRIYKDAMGYIVEITDNPDE